MCGKWPFMHKTNLIGFLKIAAFQISNIINILTNNNINQVKDLPVLFKQNKTLNNINQTKVKTLTAYLRIRYAVHLSRVQYAVGMINAHFM